MTDKPCVRIEKINEVYNRVKPNEEYITKELHHHFTFQVPGFQFNPKYRQKLWDGKIRLYNASTKTLYAGLNHEVERFCTQRKYEVVYSEPQTITPFTDEQAKTFIDNLNIPFEIRDYQFEYFTHAIRSRRGILLSPTASGKSSYAYLISRFLLSKGLKKGLIIVPRIQLVYQLNTDFKDYGWDADQFCHLISEGVSKETNKPLIISTWQSLYKESEEYFSKFDFIIGDEVHTFKAKSLMGIMQNLTRAKFRIGMSGTLDDSKTHKMTLEGLFGPIQRFTTTKQLIDKGYLAQFKIKAIVLKHPKEVCAVQARVNLEYKDEVAYLIKNDKRNTFIAQLALNCEGNTMVFYQFVERHGELIYNKIKQLNTDETRKVYFIHGKVKVEERERIRGEIEKEKNAIIVTSYGTLSTGSNFKNLHNIIFGSNFKSVIVNLQTIGRGLRIGDNKTNMTLYDIADDMRNDHEKKKIRENHTLKHFIERLQLYTTEAFQFKIYKRSL